MRVDPRSLIDVGEAAAQVGFRDRTGGLVLVAYTQQPASPEPPTPDDTFRDVLDVAGVAIPLALIVLVIAASWPNFRRWARHRLRRRRRRRHHDAQAGTPPLP